MRRIERLTDIPAEDLDRLLKDFKSERAVATTVEPQDNGLWTVIVEFTDDDIDIKKQSKRVPS